MNFRQRDLSVEEINSKATVKEYVGALVGCREKADRLEAVKPLETLCIPPSVSGLTEIKFLGIKPFILETRDVFGRFLVTMPPNTCLVVSTRDFMGKEKTRVYYTPW